MRRPIASYAGPKRQPEMFHDKVRVPAKPALHSPEPVGATYSTLKSTPSVSTSGPLTTLTETAEMSETAVRPPKSMRSK